SSALNQVIDTPPAAVGDVFAMFTGTTLNVYGAGVLANDNDADGGPLSAIPVSLPTHGVLTLNADGSFSYTPAALYLGVDSFTYKANDGSADSNVAQVTIAVGSTLVAVNDDYVTDQGTALHRSAPGLLGNDTGATTAALVLPPLYGTVTLNTDGSFDYT